MERRFGCRDLNFAGGKACGSAALLQPSAEERLAAPVFAAHRFEPAAAGRNGGKVAIDGSLEALHADRERGQAVAGHRTAAQGIENCAAALRAGHGD
jgi:hypothetical protein